jgi:hypothetical protein
MHPLPHRSQGRRQGHGVRQAVRDEAPSPRPPTRHHGRSRNWSCSLPCLHPGARVAEGSGSRRWTLDLLLRFEVPRSGVPLRVRFSIVAFPPSFTNALPPSCSEELEAYFAEGVVNHMGLAFSRDTNKKVYIQDKMNEDAELLAKMLEEGAFYLCGPTKVTSPLRSPSFTFSFFPRQLSSFFSHIVLTFPPLLPHSQLARSRRLRRLDQVPSRFGQDGRAGAGVHRGAQGGRALRPRDLLGAHLSCSHSFVLIRCCSVSRCSP